MGVLLKELNFELHLTYASITGKLEIRKRREKEGMKIENLKENKELKKVKKAVKLSGGWEIQATHEKGKEKSS